MKSPRKWPLVLAVLLLSACSDAVPPWRQAPWPGKDFDVVSADQSGCLFGCPAFHLDIHADGRVRHSGPAFEHTGGIHESRIDRRGLAQIAAALREARFDEMRDSYQNEGDGCADVFTDMSTLSFSVKRGERTKAVTLYTGCLGPDIPTERIGALVKALDQVTGTEALLEQRKRPGRSDGRAAPPAARSN